MGAQNLHRRLGELEPLFGSMEEGDGCFGIRDGAGTLEPSHVPAQQTPDIEGSFYLGQFVLYRWAIGDYPAV